jgi:hypothetical protein
LTALGEAGLINEHRRSTRIPRELSIEVDGRSGTLPFKGVTVVVNLHGALIRTVRPLEVGSTIYIRVLSGEESTARVIRQIPVNGLTYGVELTEPKNIWGVELPPSDWIAGLQVPTEGDSGEITPS